MAQIYIERSDLLNPIAFYILGLEVRWYGIIISLGILICLYVTKIRSTIYNLDFDIIFDIFLVALLFSIIGARLYYVIFNLDYHDSIIKIINIREGGLAIHGGIIGGVLSSYFMCKYKKVNFLEILDLCAPSIILGQSIGRWGNFFNSEAHGREVTKEFISKFPKFIQGGMYIEGKYFHPTFLYESFFDFLIFILLIKIAHKHRKRGVIFYTYLICYSLIRFFIEGLRTDSLMINSIKVAQLISIFIILVSIFLLTFTFKNKPLR